MEFDWATNFEQRTRHTIFKNENNSIKLICVFVFPVQNRLLLDSVRLIASNHMFSHR